MYSCGWDIVHSCNYRCPYCFFIPSWEREPEQTNSRHLACSPADWAAFWKRMARRHGAFKIEIAGGEPFAYPGFVDLVAEISREHFLRIVTNLSTPVEGVLERLDPSRVAFSASFHPHFSRREEFTGKLRRLRAAGFDAMASVVAYPSYFGGLPELMSAFARDGFELYVNPFQGRFEGRAYPESYTAAERSWLRENTEGDARLLRLREESPFGRPCGAGRRYFRLWPDGAAYRCCPATELGQKPLGHIKDPGFALLEETLPCPARVCFAPNELAMLEEPSAV